MSLQTMQTTTNGQQQSTRLISPDQGPAFSMMGVRVRPLVTAAESRGAYTLLEQVVTPGGGSPPHICHEGDKAIYVVEGEFQILLGDERVSASAGYCAIIPRGVTHNFKNVGQTPGKLLVTLNQASHADFLHDLSQAVAGGPPDPTRMASVCNLYGVEIIPPK